MSIDDSFWSWAKCDCRHPAGTAHVVWFGRFELTFTISIPLISNSLCVPVQGCVSKAFMLHHCQAVWRTAANWWMCLYHWNPWKAILQDIVLLQLRTCHHDWCWVVQSVRSDLLRSCLLCSSGGIAYVYKRDSSEEVVFHAYDPGQFRKVFCQAV